MKQITIDEFLEMNKYILKRGWVAYDFSGWTWFDKKPWMLGDEWVCFCNIQQLSGNGNPFKIKPYQGDWKDSLGRVK